MKCRECGLPLEDKGVSFSTTVAYRSFTDGELRKHVHDKNVASHTFECRNGHKEQHVVPHTCWCGWVQENPAEAKA